MNKVFQRYLESFAIVLINDIMVYFKNNSEHMNNLRVIFHVFKEPKEFPMYTKFLRVRWVVFLGHIISSEGVHVAIRKNKLVKDCS